MKGAPILETECWSWLKVESARCRDEFLKNIPGLMQQVTFLPHKITFANIDHKSSSHFSFHEFILVFEFVMYSSEKLR